MLHLIISCYIMLDHSIATDHTVSLHRQPYRIITREITPYHIISYCIMSNDIISYHLISNISFYII